MPLFKVKIQDGSQIDVPDNVTLELQGLKIIGDNTVDWNEPIQQNFMVLSNEIKDNKSEFTTLKTSVESSNTSSTEAMTSMHTTLLLKANASDVYDRSTMDTFLDGKSDVSHSHANYATIDDINSAIEGTQVALTAGTNITIANGVISANDTSIDWSEITGKPSIPSNVSDLTNDAGFQTQAQVQAIMSSTQVSVDLSAYYTKAEIGTINDLLAQI